MDDAFGRINTHAMHQTHINDVCHHRSQRTGHFEGWHGACLCLSLHAVLEPQYKHASLRNSTRSLKERRVEPLGNLNKSYTVRTPRGLPFNASYACTSMH